VIRARFDQEFVLECPDDSERALGLSLCVNAKRQLACTSAVHAVAAILLTAGLSLAVPILVGVGEQRLEHLNVVPVIGCKSSAIFIFRQLGRLATRAGLHDRRAIADGHRVLETHAAQKRPRTAVEHSINFRIGEPSDLLTAILRTRYETGTRLSRIAQYSFVSDRA